MYILPAMCKAIDKKSNVEVSKTQVLLEDIFYVISGVAFMKIISPSLLYSYHAMLSFLWL